MSIASELNNLEGNIEDSYDAVNDMGGIVPAQRNMDNLDQAIRTIPQNTGTTYTAGNGIDITNDVISIDDTVVAELSDIPTATSDLTNDSGFITSADLPTKTSDLTNDGSDGSSTYVEATALTDGSVTKVGTGTVGGTATPIYLNSGTPTAVNKPASGSWFKGVPDISSGGVMEVGKYIDFHNANGDTSDYAVRLQTQGNNQVAVNLPTSSGTLALTSQLPTSSSGKIQIGSVLIQWGKATVSSATANTTVSLPQSYGNTNYNVMLSAGFNEGAQSYWWAFFTSKAFQSFTCRAGYKGVSASGGGNGSCEVNWMTIGVKS